MSGRRTPRTTLPAPYLKRIAWKDADADRPTSYPFSLPCLQDPAFELCFTTPVTILVGENGSGKSTLIEAMAALSGLGQVGGNKDHVPRRHRHDEAPDDGDEDEDPSGAILAEYLRAAWLPKLTYGWFFRAETFWTLARFLDQTGSAAAGFLRHSHGEGFLRVFVERCSRQGIYLMDEPESALSPHRQLDLLALLAAHQQSASAQVILATHSPILMALPGARLLEVSRFGLHEISLQETPHYRLYRSFCADPAGFVAEAIEERLEPDP